mmetsp:Transcript_13801/g.35579  ORF Transcript_13801/g.35579 Transcript_13801/m.35579 type:complete len:228 (+) Transcript_13801:96-779(+)
MHTSKSAHPVDQHTSHLTDAYGIAALRAAIFNVVPRIILLLLLVLPRSCAISDSACADHAASGGSKQRSECASSLSRLRGLNRDATVDLSPADEAPVLVYAPREGNLLLLRRAHRRSQRNLGQIGAHRLDAAARRRRANIHHEDLALGELLHLALLLAVCGLDTKQAAQQVVAHLNLRVDLRQCVHTAKDLADEPVGARERRVDEGADTDESARNGVLQVVRLGEER